MLPVIKASTAVGLPVGLRRPLVGAAASAALVAFYAAAVAFHGFAGDHPAAGLPASRVRSKRGALPGQLLHPNNRGGQSCLELEFLRLS